MSEYVIIQDTKIFISDIKKVSIEESTISIQYLTMVKQAYFFKDQNTAVEMYKTIQHFISKRKGFLTK